MIFPFPDFIKYFKSSPMTISLIMTNVFLFMVFFVDAEKTNYSSKLLSEEMMAFTGVKYVEYIQHQNLNDQLWQRSLQFSDEDQTQMRRFGSLALKDNSFLTAIADSSFSGDQIKVAYWKKLVQNFYDQYNSENLTMLGLSSNQSQLSNWISYQFSHASIYHLLSNMIFLMLVGILLERMFSTYTVALVYLLGGVVGGWLYLNQQQGTFVPVVGASGSISALMMFYVFSETKKRIRYFYFLSPFQGHYGMIYLSPLLMVLTFFVSDLTEWYGSSEMISDGVAYTAHIGGGLCGLALAMAYKLPLILARGKATS